MIQTTKLKNGLTLNTYNKAGSTGVAISVSVKAGSFLEELEGNYFPKGTAHFLEHMMFKGTKNSSSSDISNKIFEVGGMLNAFTDFEETRYLANVPKDEWKLAFDLLLDILANPLIPAKDIDNERKIINQEIKMYADDSATALMDTVQTLIFPQDVNRHSILGTEETIAKINHEVLTRFYSSFYSFENMQVVVVGNLDHEEIASHIENTISPNELKEEVVIPKYEEFNTSFNSFFEDDKEQSVYVFGLRGPSATDHKKTAAFEVLSLILGGSDTSRLFKKIREEHGLCYDIQVSADYYSDYSLLLGYMGVSEENIEEAEELIFDILDDLDENNVLEEELLRAKKHLKGVTLMQMDSTNQLNSYIADSISLGIKPDLERYIQDIMNVTLEDIKSIIDEFFTEDNYFSASIVSEEFILNRLED